MTVRELKDLEEFFKEQEDIQNMLDILVKPEQKALKPGDYAVMNYLPDPEGSAEHITIYYEIIEPHPQDPPLRKNRRLVRGFSQVCPEGEYGTMHIAQLQPIHPEYFEMAESQSWPELPMKKK